MGSGHPWGAVTRGEPPALVAYTWHLEADPVAATDVEVRLRATDDGSGTRIDIDQSGWDRLGDQAGPRRGRNRHEWESVVPHFVAAPRAPPS